MRANMQNEETRPFSCRNRLRDDGKPYPRSGCQHCGTGGMTGCPYERKAAPPRLLTAADIGEGAITGPKLEFLVSGQTPLKAYAEICASTAIYPGKGTGSLEAVTYCALGLGEVGELQGKVKKVLRGDSPLEKVREAILDEAGDALWYLTRLAEELGSSLEGLMSRNGAKVLGRQSAGTLQGDGDDR